MSENILGQDLEYIMKNLNSKEINKFRGSNILVTGCAGFLGYYFMNFFVSRSEQLGINSIIALDNFKLGHPKWLSNLSKKNHKLKIYNFDVAEQDICEIKNAEKVDFIIHMASIASPTYYRKYPIETLDANVWGLRKLLDCYKDKDIKGFLFFSSSEIYGDPITECIPTTEEYRGNVSCTGPRACYDEAKRFGETMCSLFSRQYQIPITIARPFNNYGPGMKIDDKRVPADFAKAVFENKDIMIFSDGTPKRTFCYIADAIVGYLKILIYEKFDYFNIGIDKPEISIKQLAEIFKQKGQKVFNYSGDIKFHTSQDKDYLTDNPSRRCPVIDKAKKLLNYKPTINVEDGVERFLKFIKENKGQL